MIQMGIENDWKESGGIFVAQPQGQIYSTEAHMACTHYCDTNHYSLLWLSESETWDWQVEDKTSQFVSFPISLTIITHCGEVGDWFELRY